MRETKCRLPQSGGASIGELFTEFSCLNYSAHVSTWAIERYTLNTLNLCNANKCSENRKNQKNPRRDSVWQLGMQRHRFREPRGVSAILLKSGRTPRFLENGNGENIPYGTVCGSGGLRQW